MRVIPVLDLLNGVVVRGVAGNRAQYRPIESRLASSAEPLEVARAFRSELGLNALYVADLDAILHARPNGNVYRALLRDGFTLWIDAGLRSVDDARRLLAIGDAAAIVGLETWPSPAALAELCREVGPDRVIFSLDLRAGRALGDDREWPIGDAEQIADCVAGTGVSRIIVLDLAQVGVNGGVGTIPLCQRLRQRYPDWKIIAGGGVRDVEDLLALQRIGIDEILVASALHDGRITRREIERIPFG